MLFDIDDFRRIPQAEKYGRIGQSPADYQFPVMNVGGVFWMEALSRHPETMIEYSPLSAVSVAGTD
jgi:hypothetical protein